MKRPSENMKEKRNEAFGGSRQCKTIILIRFTSTKISPPSLEISFYAT